MRNLICFLIVFAAFVLLEAGVALVLLPWHPLTFLVCAGMVMGAYGWFIYKSFNRVPRGARMAAFFLGSTFVAQYIHGDDKRRIDRWYASQPTITREERKLKRRYFRRSALGIVGLADVPYLQFPFFITEKVVSDKLRIRIDAVDAVWTKQLDGFPAAHLQVDIELQLTIGPDFGTLRNAMSDVKFDTRASAEEGLKRSLEPDLREAAQKSGALFVWVPPGSKKTLPEGELNIREFKSDFEKAVRRFVREQPESTFVEAGLLSQVTDDDPSDGAPGGIGVNITVESIRPASEELLTASDKAAIAESEAAATIRRKEGLAQGLNNAATILGGEVSKELLLAHDAFTTPSGNTIVAVGETGVNALAGIAAVTKKPGKTT